MAAPMETIQPARLPWLSQNNNIVIINSIAVDAHDYWDASTTRSTTEAQIDAQNEPIHLDHDYLRALIANDRKQGVSTTLTDKSGTLIIEKALQELVSLPESVVVSAGAGGIVGRGHRSVSLPMEKMLANVSVESVLDSEASMPGSPPDLSCSKSSKSSSSLNSDDELSDVGLADKSTHFEDVTLDDAEPERELGEDCNQPPNNRRTLRRPPPRSATIGDLSSMRRKDGISPPLRPLPNGMRQKYPSLQGPVSGVLRDQSLNLPSGRQNLQRAASSPSSPFTRHIPPRIPSRSPSPNQTFAPNGYCVSPRTLASATPRFSHELPKENATLHRRPSWQPGRKTVKELEAEYNDEDEEVPDEAILENVPISPMPGQSGMFRSPSSTTLRSATPSPHRKPSYANLHSANIPKQAKRAFGPPPVHGHPRSPNHARPPMISHSASFSALPAEPFSRKHRSKSWTEDLSEEARRLSQALEEYAEHLSLQKRATVPNTPSSSPPRSGMAKARAKSEVFTAPSLPSIPPLQRGNVMIDPLPISKEKEAVLTRTRPSWLPPKCPKEEKRHLKEFQQMMARAAEAEKKRLLKEQESRESNEELQNNVARIWEQHVLPNWDEVIHASRTREVWWRGVPPHNRGEVWQRAIGNELELSATSFDAALTRANSLEEQLAELPDPERASSKEAAWFDAIARDVPNTFSELNMYQHGASLHDSLSNVLKAYAMYRSDVGYVYGTHLIAGVICLLLPAPEAFVLLANILNRPMPLAFLVHDQAAMARAYTTTLETLKYKFTRLHDHLTSPTLDLKPEEFLDPVFRCLFAYNLPHEHVSRIWDIFVFEGDKTFIRAAVAVLGRLEGKLYAGREEILDVVGWRNEGRWDVGDAEEFIAAVKEAGKVDEKSSVVQE